MICNVTKTKESLTLRSSVDSAMIHLSSRTLVSIHWPKLMEGGRGGREGGRERGREGGAVGTESKVEKKV